MYHVVIYKATRPPKVVPNKGTHSLADALTKAQALYQSYVELCAGGFALSATAILIVTDEQLETIQNGGFAATHQYGPI